MFACTHTCLAALRDFACPAGRLTVVNNGAAGMPNFSGTQFGVVTRIATSASPHQPLYGLQRDGVHIDALAVDYDGQAFLDRFLKRWPQGSPAHASYYHRIIAGTGLRADTGGRAVTLSIIMPVLDEAAGIEPALTALAPLRADGVEIVVVDGGSRDGTARLAEPLADQVIAAPAGRASQMNAGAAVATGDVLLFLHADTRLPDGADRLLRDGLAGNRNAVWGRFDVRIDGGGMLLLLPLLLVALMMNLRSRATGICTGDQAMFVTREAFARVGGFPPIPLMEDIALSARLKRVSRPLALRARVTTSARRWQQRGTLRTVFLMWRLRLAYFFGADPAKLARAYGYAGR